LLFEKSQSWHKNIQPFDPEHAVESIAPHSWFVIVICWKRLLTCSWSHSYKRKYQMQRKPSNTLVHVSLSTQIAKNSHSSFNFTWIFIWITTSKPDE
jgi:hypothetical protein